MSEKPQIQLRGASVGQSPTWDGTRYKPGNPAAGSITVEAINGEAFTLEKCRPVVIWSGSTVRRASNASQALAAVLGLATADADATLVVGIQVSGEFEATANQWDAVTGQVGGLTPAARYFLGAAGALTTTPPSSAGASLVLVGTALTSTKMELGINAPILL